MVLHLLHGRVDHTDRPVYRWDPRRGLYHQTTDPHFPAVTLDAAEKLDPTFYTHSPVTSTDMDAIIAAQGGSGIVVSLHECLESYADVRQRLTRAGVDLPADPRSLREWSLVMAMTGALIGIGRNLITATDAIIHGSGSYSTSDFTRLSDSRLHVVRNARDLAAVIEEATFKGSDMLTAARTTLPTRSDRQDAADPVGGDRSL